MPGVDPERFVNSVPEEILCGICCHVLNEPITTPCGHMACQDCWTTFFDGDTPRAVCPCCHATVNADVDIINEQQQRQAAHIAWKLIQQFDVYCRHFRSGCTVVTKLGLEGYHLRECPFENSVDACRVSTETNCEYCSCTIAAGSNDNHNCWLAVKELVKRQTAQLTNLAFENEKLSLELIRKENDLLDHITELECDYQRRTLKDERQISDLQQQISVLAELKTIMHNEEIERRVSLQRRNGSLGFNIIGGKDVEEEAGSAIMVSRVIIDDDTKDEDCLQVHDRILEVNGISLRGATHARAVEVIKATSDPVHMLIARKVWTKPRTIHQSTQTTGLTTRSSDKTTAGSSPQLRRSRSLELTDSANLSCSDEGLSHMVSDCVSATQPCDDPRHFSPQHDSYDSAYDTLMTNRSARSGRSASCSSQQDEDDVAVRSTDDTTAGRRRRNICTCRNDSELSASSVGEGVDSPGLSRRVPCRKCRNCRGSLDSPTSAVEKGLAHLTIDDATSNGSSCSSRRDPRTTIVHQQDLSGGSSSCGEGEGYEYECKRVTLHSPKKDYGLYLCRGGDDLVSSVFVSEIDEDLPADRDGNIAVGDLVLEINGDSVSDIEAAYEALKSNDHVTLLVARPVFESIQENLCTETEDDMLSTLHEVESEDDEATISREAQQQQPHSDGLRPRAATDSNGEPSTEQYAVQVQRAAKEMFARNARLRSASAPSPPAECNNNSSKDSYPYEEHGSHKSKMAGKDSTTRKHSNGGSGRTAKPAVAPSPKPRRSALKSSHSGSKDSAKKPTKHVRVDPKGDWTPTEKRIWEEFKLIQSYEANNNVDVDALDKQWSVKRSKDGEHIYIRKKLPASKSKLLRNRGQKVTEERKGITTDDDAMSMYLGRYWNRDERRRQLGRNKEKKKRLLDRLATLSELQQPCESEKKITEIVQKRMTSDLNWSDGFITIEEILAQRNRDGTFNGLVHVTTV